MLDLTVFQAVAQAQPNVPPTPIPSPISDNSASSTQSSFRLRQLAEVGPRAGIRGFFSSRVEQPSSPRLEPILESRPSMESIVLLILVDFLSGLVTVPKISGSSALDMAAGNSNVCTRTSLSLKDIERFWTQFYASNSARNNAGIADSGSDSDPGEY